MASTFLNNRANEVFAQSVKVALDHFLLWIKPDSIDFFSLIFDMAFDIAIDRAQLDRKNMTKTMQNSSTHMAACKKVVLIGCNRCSLAFIGLK